MYLRSLPAGFERTRISFYFFDLFGKNLSGGNGAAWQRCLRADVPAGRFRLRRHCTILCENFNDGSLRAGLDAQLTAVSATYTAVYVLIGLGKDRAPLSLKYGMEAPAMARFYLMHSAGHQRRRSPASLKGLKRKKRAASGLGCGTLSVLPKE